MKGTMTKTEASNEFCNMTNKAVFLFTQTRMQNATSFPGYRRHNSAVRSAVRSSKSLQAMKVELAEAVGIPGIHNDARKCIIEPMYSLVVAGQNRSIPGGRAALYGPAVRDGPCLHGQKSPDTSGYLKVTLGKKNVLVHQLLVELRIGISAFQEGKAEKRQCSHFCHTKTCVVAAHVQMELPAENRSREGCLRAGFCLRPCQPGHPPPTDCALPKATAQQVTDLIGFLTL
jgi:hypothetical protein